VLTIAAAIAARTSRIRIGTWVLLLPLHNPLRVAEDAATVDILSNGRLDLGLGLGYRLEEFAAFGVDRRQRGRLMDEGIELIRRAWTEESLTFAGQFYSVRDLNVTPKPVQQPHPPLWLAARGEVPARRAARNRAGLLYLSDPTTYQAYATALRAEAVDPATMPVLGYRPCVVSDDPDRTWGEIREHVDYTATLYEGWYGEAADFPRDADRIARGRVPADARRPSHLIGSPDEIVAGIESMRGVVPLTHLIIPAVPVGMRPADTTPWLERFAAEVIPRFQHESQIGA
jgi:probable F420-dependent oxidoreductase